MKKRHGAEQIVAMLRQADVVLGKGSGPDRISQRRACRVLSQPRGTQRYQPRRAGDEQSLLSAMRRLAGQRPRFGCPWIHEWLLTDGWNVNHKRIHRLWKQQHLQVPKQQHRRRRLPGSSENSCIRHRAQRMNHVWSYDFLVDRTEDGRQQKLLAVIDEYTRECLALEVSRSFTASGVIEILQYLFAVRGRPEHLRSDNGPEFVAQAVRCWLAQADVKTAKGSPWENGYVESFNGKLRDELLNRELFLSLDEARWVIDRWRLDYNHRRIHSALDYQTPAAFAAACAAPLRPTASAPQHTRSLNPNSLTQPGTKNGG